MEERISEGNRDQKGIEYIPPGVRGELEPFMRAHTAHFVSMIMAVGFRRGRARVAAVDYGTGKGVGMPISSATLGDLAYYYNHLIREAEIELESFKLYEKFLEKQFSAEDLVLSLKTEEHSLEEKQELLKELTKLYAEVEKLTESMEKLDNA